MPSKGYCQDTANKYEDFGNPGAETPVVSLNEGWLKRKSWFGGSQWVDFAINIHSDICTLRNYLPPNIKLEFILERNFDSFCLMGSPSERTTYHIDLENIHLTLDRIEPSAEVQKWYSDMLRKGYKPRLEIDRSVIKTYTVTANKSDLSHYNIISGAQLPEQLIIGAVTENSYNGTLNTNPYNFKDWNLIEGSLLVNGRHEPHELYRMNKDNKETADIWSQFLNNTGVQNDDREFGISKEDYFGGCFLLAFDRTQDKCNRFHRHIMESGNIDVNLKTGTALSETALVIIYGTYSTDLVIDGDTVIKYMF